MDCLCLLVPWSEVEGGLKFVNSRLVKSVSVQPNLKPSGCSSDSKNSNPIWTPLFVCSPRMRLQVNVLLTQVRGRVMGKKYIIVKSRFYLWTEASRFGSRDRGKVLRQELQVSNRGVAQSSPKGYIWTLYHDKTYKLLILGTSKCLRRCVDMSGYWYWHGRLEENSGFVYLFISMSL